MSSGRSSTLWFAHWCAANSRASFNHESSSKIGYGEDNSERCRDNEWVKIKLNFICFMNWRKMQIVGKGTVKTNWIMRGEGQEVPIDRRLQAHTFVRRIVATVKGALKTRLKRKWKKNICRRICIEFSWPYWDKLNFLGKWIFYIKKF